MRREATFQGRGASASLGGAGSDGLIFDLEIKQYLFFLQSIQSKNCLMGTRT